MELTPSQGPASGHAAFGSLTVRVQQVGEIAVDPSMAYTFTPADSKSQPRQGTFDAAQGAELLRMATSMQQEGDRSVWGAWYQARLLLDGVETFVDVPREAMSRNDVLLRDTLFAWAGVPLTPRSTTATRAATDG